LITINLNDYHNAVYFILFQLEDGIQLSKPFVINR